MRVGVGGSGMEGKMGGGEDWEGGQGEGRGYWVWGRGEG